MFLARFLGCLGYLFRFTSTSHCRFFRFWQQLHFLFFQITQRCINIDLAHTFSDCRIITLHFFPECAIATLHFRSIRASLCPLPFFLCLWCDTIFQCIIVWVSIIRSHPVGTAQARSVHAYSASYASYSTIRIHLCIFEPPLRSYLKLSLVKHLYIKPYTPYCDLQ